MITVRSSRQLRKLFELDGTGRHLLKYAERVNIQAHGEMQRGKEIISRRNHLGLEHYSRAFRLSSLSLRAEQEGKLRKSRLP